MEAVVLIPGILTLLLGLRKGPAHTFLNFYLPTLFILPEYYRWTIQLIPKVTFSQPVILVTIMALVIAKSFRLWKLTLTDVIVFSFVVTIAISEYTNKGYKEAQNLTFDMLTWFFLPYLAAKAIIEPMGLRVAYMRRMVELLAIVSVISLYEFRMGATPFQFLLSRFFPFQGAGWVTTFRWGFARVAGPYGHSILAGLIFVIGYRMQRWLEWNHSWEPRFKKLPIRYDKGLVLRLVIFGGVVMSMVRGPWIGGIFGSAITIIGNSANPRKAGVRVGLIALAIGIPVGSAFYSYVSVGRANAKTTSQETAAYRKELIDKYMSVAEAHAMFGYGRNNFPIVAGMTSVDNYYLLLSLWHGFIASGILLILFFMTVIRLFLRGLHEFDLGLQGPFLSFTLAATFVAILFTLSTVYMGTQVIPIVAMLLGWSDGYLIAPIQDHRSPAPVAVSVSNLRFARVVT